MPRKKSTRKRKNQSVKEKDDNIKKIKVEELNWEMDGFITQKIFLILSVSSLANCKIVCKKWNTIIENEDLWKQKYIASAELKITQDRKRHKTFYKTIYLDRFGREAQMAILYNNFKNTQNRLYLRRLEELASTTYASLESMKDSKLLIFVDKYSEDNAYYNYGTDSFAYSVVKTFTLTVYSKVTFQRVCFVAELICCRTCDVDNIDYWSLYRLPESSSVAESLFIDQADCSTKEYNIDNYPIIYRGCYSYIGKILGIKEEVGAVEFVSTIRRACTIYVKNETAQGSTLEEMIQKHEEMENKSDSEKQIWYNDLALLAAGEIRKMEAIEKAKEYNVPPNILLLLENTVFRSSGDIGQMRAEFLFDNKSGANRHICYCQRCCLFLNLPGCDPTNFYASGECHIEVPGDGDFLLSFKEHAKNEIIVRFLDTFLPNEGKLQKVVNSLNVPDLTTSELFTYLIFCVNMQDSISAAQKEKPEEKEKHEKKWWEFTPIVVKAHFVETDYVKNRLQEVHENMVYSHKLLKWNGQHRVYYRGKYKMVAWDRLSEPPKYDEEEEE